MKLKKYLIQFTKEQLIDQAIELSKKYKVVKEYYEFMINPNMEKEFTKTKDSINECFFPKRGGVFNLRNAKKAISDFKKLSPGSEELSDVMLYYVECGVRLTNEYGDIDEPFYNSIENMFNTACEYISQNKLKIFYQGRCEIIVNQTSDIGWGFHDAMSGIYYDFFEIESSKINIY